MQSQKEHNMLQTLRKKDLDEQRELHEKALGDLREEKEKEIQDIKTRADEKEQEHKKNVDELGKKKDAEVEALQQQSKDDLEQQKSMTLKAEEKCQHLEKQLSGGDAGMKDMQARLARVSVQRLPVTACNETNSIFLQMESELSAANKARDAAEKNLSKLKEAAKEEAAKAKSEVEKQLSELREAREMTQSELDDLLMVFGDLEEKMTKYKVGWQRGDIFTILDASSVLTSSQDRLIELGETVSDGEDDDEDDDDEEEENGSDADGSEGSDNNDDEKDETKEQPNPKSKK